MIHTISFDLSAINLRYISLSFFTIYILYAIHNPPLLLSVNLFLPLLSFFPNSFLCCVSSLLFYTSSLSLSPIYSCKLGFLLLWPSLIFYSFLRFLFLFYISFNSSPAYFCSLLSFFLVLIFPSYFILTFSCYALLVFYFPFLSLLTKFNLH